jgi:hypothetical protein
MIGTLVLAVTLVAGSVVLFAVSIRVGILFGRRLDRALEVRTSEDSETPPSVDAGESIAQAGIGQEENRGD